MGLSGDGHRRMRQLLMPPFHGERMRSYGQLIRDITEEVMRERVAGKTFPVRKSMQKISMRVMFVQRTLAVAPVPIIMKDTSALPPLPYRKPAPGIHPSHLWPDYVASVKRAPSRPLVQIPQTLSEITGPSFQSHHLRGGADLTAQGESAPLGQKILLTGRVLDENGKPVRRPLSEGPHGAGACR
jgi:hypothetical protein